MPYKISNARGYFCVKLSGEITLEIITGILSELAVNADFWQQDRLWDFRGCIAKGVSSADASMITDAKPIEFLKNNPGKKVAVVAEDDFIFGMSRMFQVQMRDLPTDIQVFRKIEDAEKWIEE